MLDIWGGKIDAIEEGNLGRRGSTMLLLLHILHSSYYFFLESVKFRNFCSSKQVFMCECRVQNKRCRFHELTLVCYVEECESHDTNMQKAPSVGREHFESITCMHGKRERQLYGDWSLHLSSRKNGVNSRE